jgi:hypothetical protein
MTTRAARASSRPSPSAAVRKWITHGSRVGLAMNSSMRSKASFTGRPARRDRSAAMMSMG